MKSLRVAHIINNLAMGGAELLLKNTVNALHHSKHLVVYLNKPDELLKQFKGDVTFVCLQHSSWTQLFRSIQRLNRILRKWKPDIIHAHLFDSSFLTRLAKPGKIPLVSTIHSLYSADAFLSKKALWVERITARKQKAIIGVSQHVVNDYLENIVFKGETFVLYNFLPSFFFEEKTFIKDTHPEFRCVAVGNLKYAKNYEYLIDVFKDLKEHSISLDIYGDGPLREKLQGLINKYNVKVKLCGKADNIVTTLTKYDLFIQASRHEGYGLSVAEAIALKIPVVLSDIPVFREITGEKALFFPLDNATKAAKDILELKTDLTLRTKYINEAYDHISSMASEKMYLEKLTSIYKRLIN